MGWFSCYGSRDKDAKGSQDSAGSRDIRNASTNVVKAQPGTIVWLSACQIISA